MQALNLKRPLYMDEEKTSGIFDTPFKLKDIVQFVGLIIGGTIFIVTMNAKIDALTNAVNELKDNGSKQSVTNDLAIKSIQNQVQTNTIQISLIQKDVETLKSRK